MTAIEDADDDEVFYVEPREWSWARVVSMGVSAVGGVLGALQGFCTDLDLAITAHTEYKHDRRAFVESVTSDIDRIASQGI